MKFSFPVDVNNNKITFCTNVNKIYYKNNTIDKKLNTGAYIDSTDESDTEISDIAIVDNYTWSSSKIQSELNNKATDSELDEVSKKINNLVNNTGTILNDNELQDIRVAYDGTSHNSAGLSVRTQVSESVNKIHECGVLTFTHVYDSNEKIHKFTNPLVAKLNHVSGKAKITALYNTGDNFLVNDVSIPCNKAYIGNNSIDCGVFAVGNWISFIVDDESGQINFDGDNGGVTRYILNTSTAAESQVLYGKSFYSKNKILKYGTMPNNEGSTFTYSGSTVTISSGYYNNNVVSISGGDHSGWTYTYPSSADTGTANNKITIPQGYHDGTKSIVMTGGNKTNWTYTYPTGTDTSNASTNIKIPQGYHNGNGDFIVSGTYRAGWTSTYPSANGNVTIPQGYHNGNGHITVPGGNNGNWGYTFDPNKLSSINSIPIPQGYHNGNGVVSIPTKSGFTVDNLVAGGTYTIDRGCYTSGINISTRSFASELKEGQFSGTFVTAACRHYDADSNYPARWECLITSFTTNGSTPISNLVRLVAIKSITVSCSTTFELKCINDGVYFLNDNIIRYYIADDTIDSVLTISNSTHPPVISGTMVYVAT